MVNYGISSLNNLSTQKKMLKKKNFSWILISLKWNCDKICVIVTTLYL